MKFLAAVQFVEKFGDASREGLSDHVGEGLAQLVSNYSYNVNARRDRLKVEGTSKNDAFGAEVVRLR